MSPVVNWTAVLGCTPHCKQIDSVTWKFTSSAHNTVQIFFPLDHNNYCLEDLGPELMLRFEVAAFNCYRIHWVIYQVFGWVRSLSSDHSPAQNNFGDRCSCLRSYVLLTANTLFYCASLLSLPSSRLWPFLDGLYMRITDVKLLLMDSFARMLTARVELQSNEKPCFPSETCLK